MSTLSGATLPTDEAVARSYVRPLWDLRTLPAYYAWQQRRTLPRCGFCIRPRCVRPTVGSSLLCRRHAAEGAR